MARRATGSGQWRLLLIAVAIALVATSCGGEGATSTTTTIAEAAPSAAASGTTAAQSNIGDGFDPFVVVVNVDITDHGYEPETIFLPVGRSIQLIIRNRTSNEHHYRIQGLEAEDLLWLTDPDMEIQEGVSEEEHLFHHQAGYVNWRGTSPRGITPTLEEVHGYAAGGVNDMVRFTPMSLGTFVVDDPLHPEYTGSVTVFD